MRVAIVILLAGACADDPDGAGGSTGFGGAGGSAPTPMQPSERRDFRGFGRFTIAQADGLGSCPDRDQVYASELVRRSDGDFSLTFTTLRSEDDYRTCLAMPPEPPASCDTPIEAEPRTVSAFEAGPLEGLFVSLPVLFFPAPECEDYGIDPCRILVLEWDGFGVSDYPCGYPRISGVFAEIILEEVSALAAGTPFP